MNERPSQVQVSPARGYALSGEKRGCGRRYGGSDYDPDDRSLPVQMMRQARSMHGRDHSTDYCHAKAVDFWEPIIAKSSFDGHPLRRARLNRSFPLS
jgi:hypothetical protein